MDTTTPDHLPSFIKKDNFEETEEITAHSLGDGIIHHGKKPDPGEVLYGQKLFDHNVSFLQDQTY